MSGRSTPAGCPGDDTISRWLASELDPPAVASVEEHIDVCEPCRSVISAAVRCAPEIEPGAADGRAAVGRYVVIDRIGAGGMGDVYAAHDPELRRMVALKLVRGRLAAGDGLREAQAMARLNHPNVVAVYDVGLFDGELFIAMELVDGTTLRAWLARGPDPREIVEVLIAAGRGLEAAHAAGLVHGDFKPENVLIGSDGRVRVGDFGLGATPGYMAPEQRAGEPVGPAADQYAFCVTAREALGEAIGPRIRAALDRGLAAAPSARHPSLGAVLAALDRRPRRRWLAVGAVAAAAAVLAVAIGSPRDHRLPVAHAHAAMLVQAGDRQIEAGDYADAERLLYRAIDVAAAGDVAAFEARAWISLLYLYGSTQSRLGEADVTVRAASAARARAGSDPELEQQFLASLALFDVARGRYAEAERSARRVVTLARERSGGPGPGLSAALASLGWVQRNLGQLEAARDSLEQSLASDQEAAAPNPLTLLSLASTVYELGDEAAARRLAAAALAVLEPPGGAAHPDARLVHLELARYDTWVGRFDDAVRHAERAGEIAVASFGPDHVTVAEAIGARGEAELYQGRYAAARDHLDRAYRTAVVSLGGDSNVTAALGLRFGEALIRTGQIDQAEQLFRAALADSERLFGADHPFVAQVLLEIAFVDWVRGDMAAAREAYVRALAIYRRDLGDSSYLVAATLPLLAAVERELGDCANALEHLATAKRILDASGADGSSLADVHATVATCRNDQERWSEALAEAERALVLYARHPREPAVVAWAEFQAARALWSDRGQRAAAGRRASAAAAVFAASGPSFAAERAQIAAWQRTHRTGQVSSPSAPDSSRSGGSRRRGSSRAGGPSRAAPLPPRDRG